MELEISSVKPGEVESSAEVACDALPTRARFWIGEELEGRATGIGVGCLLPEILGALRCV